MNRPAVIYVDVDDTLVRSVGSKRIPVPATVEYVREQAAGGALLYCWSRGGADYARSVAKELGIGDLFQAFLPKPDVMVDDAMEEALAHASFVHPLNLATVDAG